MKVKSIQGLQILSAAFMLTCAPKANAAALPMEVVGFQAIVQQNEVLLAWTTMTQNNSSHFVIERSANGTDFTPIGSVNAAGFSMIRIDYKWADEDPMAGVGYYRLRQMDMDGSWELSEVLTVNYITTGEVNVYPNPAADLLSLEITGDNASEVIVKVFDAGGRQVHEMMIKDGRNITNLDIDRLPAGTYHISTTSATGVTASGRFIKK